MDVINSVKPEVLIERTAEKLKEFDELKPPEFIYFVKTGAHTERSPEDPEKFWYTRCASILRKAYVEGKIGVGRLATWYGGRKNRGSKPEHHVDAGRSIIRKAVQGLEKIGFLRKARGGGRRISYEGYVFLTKIACEILGVKYELDENKFAKKQRKVSKSKLSKPKSKSGSSSSSKSRSSRTESKPKNVGPKRRVAKKVIRRTKKEDEN